MLDGLEGSVRRGHGEPTLDPVHPLAGLFQADAIGIPRRVQVVDRLTVEEEPVTGAGRPQPGNRRAEGGEDAFYVTLGRVF
jgi:hypothetical protein